MKIRVEAPRSMDREQIAEAIAGPLTLLKADPAKYEERTFSRYKALRETTEEFILNYRQQLDKIIRVIRAYVEKNIILGSLDKAEYKPVINPAQLQEIVALISDYHLAFIATQVGPGFVSAGEVQRLIDVGVLPSDLNYTYQPSAGEKPPTRARMIADAYNYGVMMGSTPVMRAQATTLAADAFRKRKEPKLTPQENAAREWAQQSAASEIRGLGNTIADDFSTMAIEADSKQRKRYQQAIREELDMNIEKRESWRTLASELGHRTGDWARDFRRIAATEKQGAMQEGFVSSLIEREGDPQNVWVAKMPAPDACFIKNTRITTRQGSIPIEEIKIGDEVLTHKLRWRRVTKLFRRRYRGSVLGIDSTRPCATENHPFLCGDGEWKRADALQCGDEIVCLVGVSDSDNNPTERSQNSFFQDVTRAYLSRVMPLSTIDFDSDMQRRDRDINVEFRYGHLKSWLKACSTKLRSDPPFYVGGTRFSRLARFCFFHLALIRAGFLSSLVRVFDSFFSLVGGQRSVHGGSGFRSCFEANASFYQSRSNRQWCDSIFSSDASYRSGRLPVVVDDFIDWEGLFRLRHYRGIATETRTIKSIVKECFEGEVYNLEVEEDHSYFAEGMAVHNCDDCIRLHLKSGPGSNPRIFRLATLINNGSNVGRKRQAWLPVVGVLHPWCHQKDTKISVPGGTRNLSEIRIGDSVLTHQRRFRTVERISKRAYRGNLIVFGVGDQFFKVTPDHPYLTQRGWVPASDFKTGDYLMKVLDFLSVDVGAYDNPIQRFEVSSFLNVLRDFPFRSVPSIINFNSGEGRRQCEIDIEWAYRELRESVKSFGAQSIEYLLFVLRHTATLLTSLCAFYLLDKGARFAASSVVRSVDLATALLRSHSFPFQFQRFGGCPDYGAVIPEMFVDGFSSNAMYTSDFRSAHSALVLRNDNGYREFGALIATQVHTCLDKSSPNRIGRDTELFSNSGGGFAFQIGGCDDSGIQWDFVHNDVVYLGVPITSIHKEFFEGDVYSLKVDEDESYLADGFVVHNCGCELIHVPAGWGFDEDGDLIPMSLKRSQFLEHDLKKAESNLTYTPTVPDKGCAIRVGDPLKVTVIEKIIRETPREIFDKKIGVTFITIDHPRVQNPMDDHDLAYWTGNEIRLSIHLAPERLPYVVRHEIGHSLNVHLMYKMGGVEPVRRWHRKLWRISQAEGFVSKYARTIPIENAAEATRLYLYERRRLMLEYPRTFAELHKVYRDIWE